VFEQKKHLDLWESMVGHWSLLGGSIFLAVLLALSPSNLLMNSGQNTIIFRDKKTFICSFFFLTIYELMIKKPPSWLVGQARRSSFIFLLKTSILFTLVEPILVAFRPPKKSRCSGEVSDLAGAQTIDLVGIIGSGPWDACLNSCGIQRNGDVRWM
jgi:hypothetical protein